MTDVTARDLGGRTMMKYKIYCADKDCRAYMKEDLDKKLILIGKGYHCPYCRGYRFTLKPVDHENE